VRFEVSRVMDTIEQRLTTDAALAQAVVDLGEVSRFVDLDGGRGINLIRVGMVVDALGRYLHDGGALVYPVIARPLLGDGDLTSKERMVLGRWADDGLIEVTPNIGERIPEVADLAGLAVVGRRIPPGASDKYPWLRDAPHRALTLTPRSGGGLLTDGAGGTAGPHPAPPARPSGLGISLLARTWRCGEFSCPAFGDERRIGQPVPRMRNGVPICPRHEQPLKDIGPRAAQAVLSVAIDGLGRRRFVVTPERPVVIGRSQDEPENVQLGPWLAGGAATWVSRSHVRLELREGTVTVTDLSTNGTTVLTRQSADAEAERIRLARDEPRSLGDWDVVELYTGVEVCRSISPLADLAPDLEPSSVLADAPTVAMRLPNYPSGRSRTDYGPGRP
jgi:hypothetical protein